MRTVERSTAFKRDDKGEAKGRYADTLDLDLVPIRRALASDGPLGPRQRDHALTGTGVGYRDGHVRSDLVPIGRKPGVTTLRSARLGSRSEVFGSDIRPHSA